jgi:hypothetical protein
METMNNLQKAICEKYDSIFCPVSKDEMIAIALETIGRMPVYGVRVVKECAGDVEWFIHCGEFSDNEDFYKPMHAQHISNYLPSVEKYLALDRGFKFIIDDQGYEDVWHEEC